MASSFPSATIRHHHPHRHHHRHHHHLSAKISTIPLTSSLTQTHFTTRSLSTSLLLRDHSYPPSNFNHNSRWCVRCAAISPRPPSPPSDTDQFSSSGLSGKLSTFQGKVQIFGAVLFWMSLFLWSCVWESSKNNGRSGKGPPSFRK